MDTLLEQATPLESVLHEIVCAIEMGVLSHVEGSNESGHDGEHSHPWPCERMAAEFRAKNLHLSAANFRAEGPHAFFLDPETGDEWPIETEAVNAYEPLVKALRELFDFVADGWGDDWPDAMRQAERALAAVESSPEREGGE